MAQVLPFNGFYTGSDPKNSARECVNYIPSRHDSGSLSEYTIKSTQGIGPDKYNPNHPFHGDRTFKILGKTFKISSYGSQDYAVNLCRTDYDNGSSQLFYVYFDGDDYYRAIVGDTVSPNVPDKDKSSISSVGGGLITSSCWFNGDQYIVYHSDFNEDGSVGVNSLGVGGFEVRDIAYLGNRFVYMGSGSSVERRRLYYSEILDPVTIDPLGFFGDIDSVTDNVGIHAINGRLFLFTQDGYTVWVNSPDVNLPFISQKGSSGGVGLLSSLAKTEVNGSLFFIGVSGGKKSLYSTAGGIPVYLGNEFIDSKLESLEEASLFSFLDNNRVYICISGIEAFCYDIESGEFHKRESINEAGGSERWRVTGSEFLSTGNVMIGSKPSYPVVAGEFPQIMMAVTDKTIGVEFGAEVIRKLVTSPFNSNGVSNMVKELAFQTNIDYSSGSPVTLPNLDLSVSKDFGYNYGTVKSKQFDAEGKHDKILRFMNIGFFRQAFVFKIETDTIYPHSILKMLIRLEKGFRQI